MRIHSFAVVAVLALILASSGVARAAPILVNNGLAPPTAANVIDYPTGGNRKKSVVVRNAGCLDADLLHPCDYVTDHPDGTTLALRDGGQVYDLSVSDSSTIMMTGGLVVRDLLAYGSGVFAITGGLVGEGLFAYDDSTITIVGSGFEVDGVSVPFGDLAATSGTLTGTLESGDPVANVFYQGGLGGATGTITLVDQALAPEPSTALLLGVGLVGLAAGGRRGRP